jgi:L-ascorbate metabolism protein UlaG (beta-lactamase superfamily)
VIFDLAKDHADIRFILSFDIWSKRVPEELAERTVFLKPGEVYEDRSLKAEAFKSTDEGVAFWCSVDGLEIYHAGDLNHWFWDGEDENWNRDMTAAYRNEIAKMKGRTADAAFLPLDPRLGDSFYLGIDDFMKVVDAKKIFPMHFWGEYDVAERLKQLPCSAEYRDRIAEITREGETFEV